jgi:hypothetical protein
MKQASFEESVMAYGTTVFPTSTVLITVQEEASSLFAMQCFLNWRLIFPLTGSTQKNTQ